MPQPQTTKINDYMYAIVQRDGKGLFTWYREAADYNTSKFYKEAGSSAEVVGIYRGSLEEIAKKAKGFEKANKGNYKQLKTLPQREIAALLGEGIVGLRGARGIPDNEAYLKRHNLIKKSR